MSLKVGDTVRKLGPLEEDLVITKIDGDVFTTNVHGNHMWFHRNEVFYLYGPDLKEWEKQQYEQLLYPPD